MKRSPFRAAALAACAVALTVSLTACGDDDASDGGGTLSTGEYRVQANALCKTAFTEVAEIQDEMATAATQQEAEDVITAYVDRIDELVADLRDLEEPRSVADDVDAMLDEVARVTGAVRDQGLDFFTDLTEDPFTGANEKAMALGLDDCASGTEDAS